MNKEEFKRVKNTIDTELNNITETCVHQGISREIVTDIVENHKENILWAVETQIDDNDKENAKNVIVVKDNGWNNGYNCVCPRCNHPVTIENEEYPKYCSNCGQKLKFGDSNGK